MPDPVLQSGRNTCLSSQVSPRIIDHTYSTVGTLAGEYHTVAQEYEGRKGKTYVTGEYDDVSTRSPPEALI
jgi:hypothetical protein